MNEIKIHDSLLGKELALKISKCTKTLIAWNKWTPIDGAYLDTLTLIGMSYESKKNPHF